MSAGWVAGSVRGRLLTRRRLGAAGAREVAASRGAEPAVELLARSPYGREIRAGDDPEHAWRALGSVCVWHLRVLAGWLPPRGGGAVRVFAARFELDNIVDRLAALGGAPTVSPYDLGTLGVAWPRLAAAPSAEALRAALATSPWGDPGSVRQPAVSAALQGRWASWLAAVPGGADWGAGAAALVLARLIATGEEVPPPLWTELRRQLGSDWQGVGDVAALTDRLPPGARWVLAGLDTVDDLWPADGRWWRRVDRDAAAILRTARPGPAVAAAAAARLVADVPMARAALEAAAWGEQGLEAFDAVA